MKKGISLALALAMATSSLMSAQYTNNVQADSIDVSINGTVMQAGVSMKLGNGTAIYDANTKTLVLDNASITVDGKDVETGIYVYANDFNIELKGDNQITGKNEFSNGIAANNLNVKGDGSLTVKTLAEDPTDETYGMDTRNCTITDASLSFENTSATTSTEKEYEYGLHTAGDFSMKDATLTTKGYVNSGVKVSSGATNIERSTVKNENTNVGVAVTGATKDVTITESRVTNNIKDTLIERSDDKACGIYVDGSLLVKDSTFDVSGEGTRDWGIYVNNNLELDHVTGTITSASYRGIYADADISVKNATNMTVKAPSQDIYGNNLSVTDSILDLTSTDSGAVNIKGNYAQDGTAQVKVAAKEKGMETAGNILISKGSLDVTSKEDIGIYSANGKFTMNAGKVSAKAAAKCAAIAVRHNQTKTETKAPTQITLNSNYEDKNGGTIKTTDWFDIGQDAKETRSYTSFLPKGSSGELSTYLDNASNDVKLDLKDANYTKVNTAIGKIPKNLALYTSASVAKLNKAVAAVNRDKTILDQKTVDGYATAIDTARNQLVPIVVAKPTITAQEKTAKTIKISWKKTSYASYYQVYRRVGKSGTYKKVKTLSATSWTDTKRKIGSTYYYKVRAYRNAQSEKIYSSYSSYKKVYVRPYAPIFKLKKKGKKVYVTWKRKSYGSGYQIANNNRGKMKTVKTTKQITIPKYTSFYRYKGKTYSYKMRTYKIVNGKRIYSKWSKIKKVKI